MRFDVKENSALMLSGGMDSHVLYHLMLKQGIKLPTLNIKKPNGMDDNKRADVAIKHLGRPTDKDTYEGTVRTVRESILTVYDEVWVASNALPPGEEWSNHPQTPPRPSHAEENARIRLPFLHLTKDKILQLAIDNDISIKGTHSCVSNATVHCRMCWFCKEREWAHRQLGIDTVWD
tara:strand:- start:274 stop:804 length:531 start_codon:yes stop_codon:yes gene_type:complete